MERKLSTWERVTRCGCAGYDRDGACTAIPGHDIRHNLGGVSASTIRRWIRDGMLCRCGDGLVITIYGYTGRKVIPRKPYVGDTLTATIAAIQWR